MSEKQSFNKGINLRQIAEKRRERWMSRKILTEILETIRLQKNDANWILYQIFSKETLTYKSKIKIWNHLMRAGYDLAKEKPQKKDKIFSYKETWKEYKENSIIENVRNSALIQKMTEENHKLYQQLNEANELLKDLYTHLTEKGVRTAWETLADANTWGKILDKIKKRFNDEKKTKKMDI